GYASDYERIYPIASRCGVFAKSDIQALINQGASKEDISCSVFQSVVNQTISNLACGRPIKGKVAFLGGPLHFLSNLRERFIETLDLGPEDIIFPENSQLYVAIGAAIASAEQKDMPFLQLRTKLDNPNENIEEVTEHLPPLFKNEEEYNEFKKRHDEHRINTIDIEGYQGDT